MSNKIVCRFEKVSFEEFKKSFKDTKIADFLNNSMETEEDIKDLYDKIELPHRSTKRSSGYDFSYPYTMMLPNNQSVIIPSGIRCVFFEDGYDLNIQPRSGLGFKFRVQLDNTIGLIDNDYFESENSGHIMVKLSCMDHNGRPCIIQGGKGYAQGVIRPFYLAEEDEVTNQRNGGMGSTDNN